MVVAIDSDLRVKRLKGNNRPVICQIERQFMLENLRSVDIVEVFDQDQDIERLILQYGACIMVKGSDYQNQSVLGSHLLKVVYYDRTTHSTTQLIQDIAHR